MKTLISTLAALLVTSNGYSSIDPNVKLPENGKIQIATLSGSYSCPEAGKYRTLNLSGETQHDGTWNSELYINFACGSEPRFQGSGLSVIADMGNKKLEELDYYTTLTPKWQVGESYDFRKAALIKEGNAYSLILNTTKYRGLMAFRVISYKQNILTIEYVTREYSLIEEPKKSEYIDYDEKNSY